jgi:hypothetical protein
MQSQEMFCSLPEDLWEIMHSVSEKNLLYQTTYVQVSTKTTDETFNTVWVLWSKHCIHLSLAPNKYPILTKIRKA